ncbi:MAG: 6-carboxytetrahydropterin synthase QueD [Thermovirgaceae bacterium]
MFLKKEFTFDAAHKLEQYHGKCEALHGHTYRLEITLEGMPGAEGMVMDFLALKDLVKTHALSYLDHAYLNDVISQPTAERIALWIWNQIDGRISHENCSLYSVQVWETATSSVVIHREDAEAAGPGFSPEAVKH